MPPHENNRKLIVLIEDEQVMVDILTKKLEQVGYMVKSAMDGESGLKLIDTLEPDFVLLDMMLPKIDGFGVLERLYRDKKTPRLPVVIISNSGQPVEIERAQKLGIRDYLVKVNFDPNEILAKVEHVLAAEASSPFVSPVAAPGANGKIAVLLVEDDLFLVQLLERKFAQQPYVLSKAVDVEQARAVLNQNPVDIILLDIVLPGTDGFTFLRELKTHVSWKDIPVIIMSNLGQQEEVERGLREGATDYVIKAHVTPQEIVEKINSVAGKIKQ